VRVVALHEDVLVAVSAVWRTTSTLVRAGDEALLIDSPVYPHELEALPALAQQSGFDVRGLIATHGDWDHVLGPLAFPAAPLGVAETTAARLRAEPGAAQRELRSFDGEHYVERGRPLSLGAVEALPVPGKLDLGDRELELHPADGHVQDGMALFAVWAGVLVCGDYLSPVEIPMISPGGSLSAYRATLRRLAPLVERAASVVPGHGAPLGRDDADRLLAEDLEYLEALARDGEAAPLPEGRRTAVNRQVHAENVARVA
jgi:glyoxylase-like metal-dependent hydrolase (beta-lactamase superfamily II)